MLPSAARYSGCRWQSGKAEISRSSAASSGVPLGTSQAAHANPGPRRQARATARTVLLSQPEGRGKRIGIYMMRHAHAIEQERAKGLEPLGTHMGGEAFANQDRMGQVGCH